jgi:hypothetical protein
VAKPRTTAEEACRIRAGRQASLARQLKHTVLTSHERLKASDARHSCPHTRASSPGVVIAGSTNNLDSSFGALCESDSFAAKQVKSEYYPVRLYSYCLAHADS